MHTDSKRLTLKECLHNKALTSFTSLSKASPNASEHVNIKNYVMKNINTCLIFKIKLTIIFNVVLILQAIFLHTKKYIIVQLKANTDVACICKIFLQEEFNITLMII